MAAFALGPAATEAGYRLLGYDAIGSTSAEALTRARAGDRGPLWIAARSQSAGYGRRGRVWHSPAGNLAASLLTVVRVPPAEAATLGFVAGLALAAVLDATVPAPALRIGVDGAAGEGGRIALKWPNDVVVGGAKIAGILVEAEELDDGARAIVVGIGVNVVAAPEGLPYAATSLAALGAQTSAETLFRELAEAWLPLARQWQDEGGFAALRAAWLARASGFGAAAVVQRGGTVVRGTFETIDDSGRLIVRGADGARHAIAAGEVHFGAAATATVG